jgi:hypothetical protein
MKFGNKPVDGGHLLLNPAELNELGLSPDLRTRITRRILGSAELIDGSLRYCLWIRADNLDSALENPGIKSRVDSVYKLRIGSTDEGAQAMASRAHQFREMNEGIVNTIVVPAISSEKREFITADYVSSQTVISNRCYGLFDAPLWALALISSKMHLVWVATVCGRLELRYSYTNTLGWNTFPVPMLTEQNKADLTRCAENILLAREAHFPATIADLYDPDKMPENLRHAHEQNDEVLERIYIGRRFRNDTERLEKLFEMYTKMTAAQSPAKKTRKTAQ